MTFTKVHINAMAAMLVLLAMFAGGTVIAYFIVHHCSALGCACSEALLAITLTLGAISAGVVYVLKTFASSPHGDLPDQNGG